MSVRTGESTWTPQQIERFRQAWNDGTPAPELTLRFHVKQPDRVARRLREKGYDFHQRIGGQNK